ncbi:MAG TPA: hypothetical protein PKN36_01025, partial [bacterium]|nr:hypothetical protein [bacterium]
VMPWLAERFPKEISFGPGKARAVLWSNRSGRELDFRSSTLAKEYWQSWAEKGLGSPGISKLSGVANNAQGAARTHDIWLLPRAGGYDPLHVSKTAIAAARSPLVLAEPQWLCKTEALGWPMHHRDTEKFSREEAFISETWERLMLPHKVFPMNGFINWGHGPYITYRNVNGTWFADFLSYGDMSVYNVRRHTWSLYARSGERRYYDSGHRFNRILGDFGIAHCDAPNKLKGGFTRLRPPVHRMPFYWGNMTQVYDMNSSSSDIGNWLMEYYLSGDEYCRDVLVKVGESFRKHWNVKEATDWRTALSFLTLRKLVNLYMMEWDEDFGRMARELAHALISIEKQTGVTPEYMTYGCAMYKDQRHVPTLYMYYRETGDELGKEAFLKILDHRYRFYRNPFPISYQSAAAFAYPIAYGMTGNVNYRRVIEQTVNDGFSLFSVPLEKELANMPEDPYLWKTLPRLGVPNHTHSFLGLPTAMKFFTEKGIAGNPFPLLVKSMKDTPSRAVFLHQGDRDTVINLFCYTPARGNVKPELTPYPLSSKAVPLPGIRIEMEERIETMVPITYGKPASPNYQYHVKLAVPSSVPAGMYLLSLRGNEPFVILDSTSPKVALHCPEGFWTAFAEVEGDGWAVNGQGNASRLGDCQPFFFRVPEGLKELEIFLGRPVEIMTAGGKVMLEADTKSTGRISVPVSGNHGIWMIAPSSRDPMVFVRLLNVNPLVSYGSASRLPEKALEEAVVADAESLPLSGMEFVPGISGKALRLYGEQFIKFPSGKEERQGGYTFFPGKQGTVEFWFKPDWSSRYIVLGSGDSYRVLSFLQGPHIHAGYRYGSRASQKLIYSDLILELLGTFPGAEPLRPFLNAKSLIGREDNHIFKVGEWVHVAYTWSFDEKEKKWEFVTFAGGRRLDDYRSPERVRFLRVPGQSKVSSWQAKSDTFNISKEDREVVLGPFKGTMDSLRISDIVRYRQDFTQPETVFEKDINTRALFLFDGTLKGSSALSAEPVEAVH